MAHPTNKADRMRIGRNKAKGAFVSYYGTGETPKTSPGRFGVLRDTRKLCSSPFCCGNRRRVRGETNLTMQERKAMEAAKDTE